MSYLPRMSKTYKEPPVVTKEEEQPSSTNLQPASSLINEKTNNPQMILKHYNYTPHALPILPGPSLADEVKEDEIHRRLSQQRRSLLKCESAKSSQVKFNLSSDRLSSAAEEEEEEDDVSVSDISIRAIESKKEFKGSKANVTKKKQSHTNVNKKKKHLLTLKTDTTPVRTYLTDTNVENLFESTQNKRKHPFTPVHLGHLDQFITNRKSPPSTLKNLFQDKKDEIKPKEFFHRSVQCTIFGSTDKIFVTPPVIGSLIRALAFLLHELNREESISCSMGERKSLMTQIQLILGDLCNESAENEFGFDTTYSDSKRMEKILADLQKYIKNTYGEKGDLSCEMENMKKLFVEWKKKELEWAVWNDTLLEKDNLQMTEVEVKDSEYKQAEITLQNKRLENDQLLAEVEFSSREMTKYQKTLVEADWDIRVLQEQLANMKKSRASRTEILGRKSSVQKFASGSKSKENEVCGLKKKT